MTAPADSRTVADALAGLVAAQRAEINRLRPNCGRCGTSRGGSRSGFTRPTKFWPT